MPTEHRQRMDQWKGRGVTELRDVEDVIWSGGGAKSAEWPQVGAWVGGPVQAKPRTYQAKEYVPGQAGAGKPKFTRSGEPIIGIKVDVLTGQRDPADPKDDGVRRMHLDKWRQIEALRHALMEAGVRHIEPGGELWVQWTGEESDGETAQPAKTWHAKYRPPANSTARITDMAGEPPRQMHPPQAAQAPQAAQWPGGGLMAQPAPAAPAQPYAQPSPQPGPSWGAGSVTTTAPDSYTYRGGYLPGRPDEPPAASAVPAAPSGPPPGGPPAQNVLTESVAASLRSQGIDTSAFTIIPG